MKPINNGENFTDTARYNPNTNGTHIFVHEGVLKKDKMDDAMLSIFSMMYEAGYVDYKDGKDKKELLAEMADQSKSRVDAYQSDNIMGL
jgi:hypothetical protein